MEGEIGMETQRYDTVVIGAGQAGLAAGYYLRKTGRSFVLLDAGTRVGDPWRNRYDSLKLFTPARYVGLPGGRFPGNGDATPTKDEMADYLESYAGRFALPVELGVRVERVWREGDTYVVATGSRRIEASNVIVASGAHREPRVPAIARDLDPSIVQLHSSDYRNPSQLRDGGVLIVGAGNSGADIALELVRTHPTVLSGPDRGHVPVDIDAWLSRKAFVRIVVFAGRHVLTLRTPMGRKARDKASSQGDLLVRVKPKQLLAAGVERVPKTTAIRDGKPVLEDGRVLDVANVIWSTGYRHDLSWIDLPIFGEDGKPMHERGVVTSEPGLAFVGLPFQFAAASDVLPGVGRDARYVVGRLRKRLRAGVAVAA
jgi:putative flavoprotein involved in K+ transport